MLLNQFVDVPARAVLFADRNRHFHLFAQLPIDRVVFGAHEVFAEIRLQRFQQGAQANSVREVEPRVVINRPIRIGADGGANRLAMLKRLAHHPLRHERRVVARISHGRTKCAKACVNRRLRIFFYATRHANRAR